MYKKKKLGHSILKSLFGIPTQEERGDKKLINFIHYINNIFVCRQRNVPTVHAVQGVTIEQGTNLDFEGGE